MKAAKMRVKPVGRLKSLVAGTDSSYALNIGPGEAPEGGDGIARAISQIAGKNYTLREEGKYEHKYRKKNHKST
jgi:hypothetical protein